MKLFIVGYRKEIKEHTVIITRLRFLNLDTGEIADVPYKNVYDTYKAGKKIFVINAKLSNEHPKQCILESTFGSIFSYPNNMDNNTNKVIILGTINDKFLTSDFNGKLRLIHPSRLSNFVVCNRKDNISLDDYPTLPNLIAPLYQKCEILNKEPVSLMIKLSEITGEYDKSYGPYEVSTTLRKSCIYGCINEVDVRITQNALYAGDPETEIGDLYIDFDSLKDTSYSKTYDILIDGINLNNVYILDRFKADLESTDYVHFYVKTTITNCTINNFNYKNLSYKVDENNYILSEKHFNRRVILKNSTIKNKAFIYGATRTYLVNNYIKNLDMTRFSDETFSNIFGVEAKIITYCVGDGLQENNWNITALSRFNICNSIWVYNKDKCEHPNYYFNIAAGDLHIDIINAPKNSGILLDNVFYSDNITEFEQYMSQSYAKHKLAELRQYIQLNSNDNFDKSTVTIRSDSKNLKLNNVSIDKIIPIDCNIRSINNFHCNGNGNELNFPGIVNLTGKLMMDDSQHFIFESLRCGMNMRLMFNQDLKNPVIWDINKDFKFSSEYYYSVERELKAAITSGKLVLRVKYGTSAMQSLMQYGIKYEIVDKENIPSTVKSMALKEEMIGKSIYEVQYEKFKDIAFDHKTDKESFIELNNLQTTGKKLDKLFFETYCCRPSGEDHNQKLISYDDIQRSYGIRQCEEKMSYQFKYNYDLIKYFEYNDNILNPSIMKIISEDPKFTTSYKIIPDFGGNNAIYEIAIKNIDYPGVDVYYVVCHSNEILYCAYTGSYILFANDDQDKDVSSVIHQLYDFSRADLDDYKVALSRSTNQIDDETNKNLARAIGNIVKSTSMMISNKKSKFIITDGSKYYWFNYKGYIQRRFTQTCYSRSLTNLAGDIRQIYSIEELEKIDDILDKVDVSTDFSKSVLNIYMHSLNDHKELEHPRVYMNAQHYIEAFTAQDKMVYEFYKLDKSREFMHTMPYVVDDNNKVFEFCKKYCNLRSLEKDGDKYIQAFADFLKIGAAIEVSEYNLKKYEIYNSDMSRTSQKYGDKRVQTQKFVSSNGNITLTEGMLHAYGSVDRKFYKFANKFSPATIHDFDYHILNINGKTRYFIEPGFTFEQLLNLASRINEISNIYQGYKRRDIEDYIITPYGTSPMTLEIMRSNFMFLRRSSFADDSYGYFAVQCKLIMSPWTGRYYLAVDRSKAKNCTVVGKIYTPINTVTLNCNDIVLRFIDFNTAINFFYRLRTSLQYYDTNSAGYDIRTPAGSLLTDGCIQGLERVLEYNMTDKFEIINMNNGCGSLVYPFIPYMAAYKEYEKG